MMVVVVESWVVVYEKCSPNRIMFEKSKTASSIFTISINKGLNKMVQLDRNLMLGYSSRQQVFCWLFLMAFIQFFQDVIILWCDVPTHGHNTYRPGGTGGIVFIKRSSFNKSTVLVITDNWMTWNDINVHQRCIIAGTGIYIGFDKSILLNMFDILETRYLVLSNLTSFVADFLVEQFRIWGLRLWIHSTIAGLCQTMFYHDEENKKHTSHKHHPWDCETWKLHFIELNHGSCRFILGYPAQPLSQGPSGWHHMFIGLKIPSLIASAFYCS